MKKNHRGAPPRLGALDVRLEIRASRGVEVAQSPSLCRLRTIGISREEEYDRVQRCGRRPGDRIYIKCLASFAVSHV